MRKIRIKRRRRKSRKYPQNWRNLTRTNPSG
jgi:hypothetical protein